MNEFSFRERWWASFKIWLTSERDFEILWFLALVVKIFFDNFGKISKNLELFSKWKVEKWPSWCHLVKNWSFFHFSHFLDSIEVIMKNGQFLTKCGQEGHFSTFHLPKSFKFVEIFPKLSKQFCPSLSTRAKNHQKSKSLSDANQIFPKAHHRSRNEISFIFC